MAAFPNVTLVVDDSDLLPYMGTDMPAGYNATMQDDVGMDSQAFLVSLSRYDWVANFGTLDANSKRILSEYICRQIAVTGILWDMDSFPSRIMAEDMLNVHLHRMNVIEKLLIDQKLVTLIK